MFIKRKLAKDETQICEAYRNGRVLRSLARDYNVCAGTIRNVLIRNNEPIRPRGRRKGVKV